VKTGSTRRLPLAGLALAAVGGILLAEYFPADPRILLGIAFVALLFAPWRFGTVALGIATSSAFALAHAWQWHDDPGRLWASRVADEPRQARITGVLVEEPDENPPGVFRAPLRVESWNLDGDRIDLPSDVVVRWSAGQAPRYGDRWEIDGVLSRIAPPRNPAEFDAAEWWGRRGVFLELRAAHDSPARLLARDQGSPVRRAALEARTWMLRTLGLGLDNAPQISALIAGITLGARDTEADEFADAFRQTGTFHLFSVSGLHVGMVALLLWLVLRPLGLGRRQAVLVIIPSLFFYALITGASAPSVRAAVMLSVAFAGFLFDRPVSPANSLAAAALLLLGYDTNQLFSPGFQMSFGIVAAIFLLSSPLQAFFSARLRPDPFLPRRLYNRRQKFAADTGHALSSTLGVSTAAWLGSLPLTIVVFHLVPLLAIPANMLSVPLAFGILAVSMLALVAGPFSAWLAAVFNNTSWGIASVLVAVVESTAALPGSYLQFPPGWMQPPARLTVFDLGEGGAQLLRTPLEAWLFDTGSESDFRRIIDLALHAAGLTRVDALVATHGDADHIGGAVAAIETVRPQRLVESALRDRSRARKNLHATVATLGRGKSLVFPGDVDRLGADASVRILHPSPGEAVRSADDQAIVARVEMDGFRVLLMSDSGAGTEDNLLRRYGKDLRSDVVVFGRHGEDIVATESFLRAVLPDIIILNRADPFRDGSDEPALRARLAESGAQIFDQEKCGAVILTATAGGLEIRGYLDNEAVTLRPR
jgi:ComEC/Rec2-related protein